MTTRTVGASSADLTWDAIDWHRVKKSVHRLQMRIAKATREQRHGKVKALQWLLTHSRDAKLLATKRVTSSKGARTPGVDGKCYRTDSAKMQLAQSLKQRGYRAKPLKRVYIPKKDGQRRPLGIPALVDRAMQALYLSALEPVSESTADINSYGFRPHRATIDAIEQCFNVLGRKSSGTWVLEADIQSCFDKISHEWLLKHIPLEKRILKQWLNAGYMEKQTLFPTPEGTPQGGILSPTLANMALDGLELAAQAASKSKLYVVRYADDFVVVGKCKMELENEIKPAIQRFLRERGLTLSPHKTLISNVNQGFDFLGFNVRKYQGKLLIKPAKKSIHAFLRNIRSLIKSQKTAPTDRLINMLNPKIRGWAYYYRHVVAKQTFGYVDDCIYHTLAQWARRRHPNKNFAWIRKHYYCSRGFRRWIFFAPTTIGGEKKTLELVKAQHISIKRHVKIQAKANPYDPAYREYFAKRKKLKLRTGELYRYWHVNKTGLGNKWLWYER